MSGLKNHSAEEEVYRNVYETWRFEVNSYWQRNAYFAAFEMPVGREGRFVSNLPDELNAWLGKESGKPVHAVTETTDLTAELKRGLSYVRHEQQSEKPKAPKKKRK